MKFFNSLVNLPIKTNTVKGNSIVRQYQKYDANKNIEIMSVAENCMGTALPIMTALNVEHMPPKIFLYAVALYHFIYFPVRHLLTVRKWGAKAKELKPEYDKIEARLQSMVKSHELRSKLATCNDNTEKALLQKEINDLARSRKIESLKQNFEYKQAQQVKQQTLDFEKNLLNIQQKTNPISANSDN